MTQTMPHLNSAASGQPPPYPAWLRMIFGMFLLIGIGIMLVAASGIATQRIWLSYLVNFSFWSGLAQGGIIFSAAYRLTNGRWGGLLRRVGEGFIFAAPLSVLLFLVTFLGRHYLWPWIDNPIPEKAAWLNEEFFFLRVTLYYAIIAALSCFYVYHSVRPDLGRLKEDGKLTDSPWLARLTKGWRGTAIEQDRSAGILNRLVPILLIAYAVLYSLAGFDVVMSLDPHWFSTLYGWLYFVHAFFAGVAAILLTAILGRRFLTTEDLTASPQLYDGSRLLMGLSMLSGGFYWSQFLVIWYGNLGEEIGRLLVRFHQEPWQEVQWIVIAVLYFFPLIVFLSKRLKELPRLLLVVTFIILIGNWLYHFIEIAPALWHEATLPLGLIDLGIFLGFLGVTGLCWLPYGKIIPLILPGRGTSVPHS